MRKADYTALSEILARYRNEARRTLAHTNDPALEHAAAIRIQQCADIARDFARVASVDKPAFLKACGINV